MRAQKMGQEKGWLTELGPGSIIVGMWDGQKSASTTEDGSKISDV
jgi:hypothetical protein